MLKPIGKTLLVGGASLIVAGLAAGFWLNSGGGKAWLQDTLEQQLSSPGQVVTIGQLSGNIFGAASIDGLAVADGDGAWLQARKVDLSWKPLKLLSGTLAIDQVQLTDGALLRVPVSQANSEPTSLPALPVAVSLGRFTGDLRFDDQLYDIRAEGLELDQAQQKASLDIRGGQGLDQMTITGHWAGRDRPFAVRATLEAGEKGLIRAFIPLDYAGPTTARLEAQGTFADWTADLLVEASDQLSLKGEGRGVDGKWRIELAQTRNLLLDGSLRELLGGTLEASLETTTDAVAPWPFQLGLQGQGLSASVVGRVDPSAGFAVTDGQLEGQLPSLNAGGVRADGLAAKAGFSFKGGRLQASYDVSVNHAVADDVTVDDFGLKGDVDGSGDAWRGSLTAIRADAAWRDVREQITGGTGTWSTDLATAAWHASLDNLATASNNQLSAFARGSSGNAEQADVELVASTAFLSRWVPVKAEAGRVDMKLSAARQDDGFFDTEATVQGVAVNLLDQSLAELVGPAPSLVARAKVAPDGRVTISSAAMSGRGMVANLSGEMSPSNLDLAYDLTLSAVPAQMRTSLAFDGKIVARGNVGGSYQAPMVTVSTGLKELAGYGVALADITFDMALAPEASQTAGWRGRGTLQAQSKMGTATSGLDFLVSPEGAVVLEAKLEHPGLDGSLTFNRLPAGDMDAKLTAALVPGVYGSSSIDGQAQLSATYGATDGRSQVGIRMNGQDVRVAIEGMSPVEVSRLDANMQLPLGGALEALQLDAAVSGVRAGQYDLEALLVSADPMAPGQFRIEARGRAVHPFTLDAAIAGSERTTSLTGSADFGGYPILLDEPAVFTFGKTIQLQAARISVGSGAVSAQVQLSANTMAADLTLADVDLKFVNLIRSGVLQAGTASGQVKAGWRRGRAEALTASLDLKDLIFTPEGFVTLQDTTRYTAHFSAHTNASSLEVSGSFSDATSAIGTIKGQLPYTFDADARVFAVRENAPLTAAVNWDGDVEPLWRLVGRGDHLLEGRIAGALSVEGTLNEPVFSGRLGLSGGHYEYLPLGLIASIEELSIVGSGDQVRLDSLRASDGETGLLTAQGAFDLSSRLDFPGDLSLKLESFQVARLDTLRGKVSADLTYSRRSDGGSLTGQVVASKMNIYLPKELPMEVVDLEVVEINGGLAAEEPVRYRRQKEKRTSLDVTIKVPDRLFVEGRGLFSEWQGELLLGGHTGDPRLNGRVTLKNGFLNFGSKRIDLEQGYLEFQGRRGFDPDLALQARYVARSIDATMTLSGILSAPTLKFQSVPELPEDEIMSRILLGRSVTELSALQVAELASAANTMRGGKGVDMIGGLRRKLGLDTLSIGRTDDEDGEGRTLVSGGKYLRDNIYLELETVPASSEAAARLQVDVAKNIALETEVGLQQRSRVRLKWFWEY